MHDKTIGSRIFDSINYLFLTIVGLVTFLPFVYVVITSFSASDSIIPTGFTLSAYKYIFSADTFTNSLMVSIYITVLGTFINIMFTCLMAYSLANKQLPGRNIILLAVLITMLFNGGMIPTYFVVKGTGLIDTLWALMIPNAISAFYLIILKNFFQEIPSELKEAAKIDGCHDVGILFRIVLPLSLPAIAAFGLFYAVGLWNQYFNAIMFINDTGKWPVQVILRQVVILASGAIGDSSGGGAEELTATYSQSIKMATIVIATIPIIIVYPFLQKHFAKGVLIGSVKG